MTYLLLTFVFVFSACSSAAVGDTAGTTHSIIDPGKVLIVYLSRTNNTKAVAGIIRKYVGGRVVALELETPYPENYRAIVGQVVKENETGFLPPLKTKIDSIGRYDVIFLGFPTWGM
jgi:flavodoxin